MKKLNTKIMALALLSISSCSVQAYNHTIMDEVRDIARQLVATCTHVKHQVTDTLLSMPGVATAYTYIKNKAEAIEARYPGLTQGVIEGAVIGAGIGALKGLYCNAAEIEATTKPASRARLEAIEIAMTTSMPVYALVGAIANIVYSITFHEQFI